VDLGLAALTNGAARTGADATPEYLQAEAEAKRNKRGIYQ
jgi:endonuclease YncB( thermonuclease family)